MAKQLNTVKKQDDDIALNSDTMVQFFSEGGTFKELKNLSDDTMESVYAVAYNLYQNAKYDDAVKMFQFLCFYDHYNAKYYLGLGACQLMMKNYEMAIEFFTFATSLSDEDPRGFIYMGEAYIGLGKTEEAIASFKAATIWAEGQDKYKKEKQRAENMLTALSAGKQKKSEE